MFISKKKYEKMIDLIDNLSQTNFALNEYAYSLQVDIDNLKGLNRALEDRINRLEGTNEEVAQTIIL